MYFTIGSTAQDSTALLTIDDKKQYIVENGTQSEVDFVPLLTETQIEFLFSEVKKREKDKQESKVLFSNLAELMKDGEKQIFDESELSEKLDEKTAFKALQIMQRSITGGTELMKRTKKGENFRLAIVPDFSKKYSHVLYGVLTAGIELGLIGENFDVNKYHLDLEKYDTYGEITPQEVEVLAETV